jgi:multiple sugar transport system permease protein
MTTTSLSRTARTATRRRRDWRGWAFVAPFMAVFVAMIIAPVFYALYLSFFRQQLIGGNIFAGFSNYLDVFQDAKFWESFGRVALFMVVQVPIMLALSMIAALALDSARLQGARFFRIAIFLPYAVPGVVAALIWGFIYGAQFGLTGSINNFLGAHFSFLGAHFLQPFSASWVLPSIGNIVTWEYMGYNMLIFYAALKVVSSELYEAAEIDGAGPLRTVFSIKIPALRGAIVIATVFSIIGSIQLFNEPNLLKTLAPNVISSYFTPNMYAYNLSFAGQQFNYAATVAIVMGVITAVIAYIVQARGSRQGDF